MFKPGTAFRVLQILPIAPLGGTLGPTVLSFTVYLVISLSEGLGSLSFCEGHGSGISSSQGTLPHFGAFGRRYDLALR